MAEVDLAHALITASRDYHRVKRGDELKWAQEKMFVMQLISDTPKLRECTPTSLASAVLQAGAMGLSLNPLEKHVYLIPRARVATASPSYRGMIHLDRKSVV